LAWLSATNGLAFDRETKEIWKQIPPPVPLQNAIRSGYAPVNDIEIYYSVYGAGRPLLLLHGGLGNMEYFGNQIPAFAKRFEVIAVDSRGHGRSTCSSKAYSYGLMASDVIALMDYLAIRNPSIVGWSDGAIIGLEIAIHHPERLNKLVAFAANYSVSGLRENVRGNSTFRLYHELAQHDYKRLSSTPEKYSEFVAAIEKLWKTQPNYSPEQLASIRAPTLVIVGEYDEAIKQSHTKEMASLIPNSKLEILPGVSHFAMLQRPEDFNRAVLEFLESQ
jgi:pimeloyl-ACP methyl ester carboxylesterase